jgi:hypothetical protein
MGGSCSTYQTDEKCNVSRRIEFRVVPFVTADTIMILANIPSRLKELVSPHAASAYCSTLKMEEGNSCETSVNYQAT